jgi:hypothetical protein
MVILNTNLGFNEWRSALFAKLSWDVSRHLPDAPQWLSPQFFASPVMVSRSQTLHHFCADLDVITEPGDTSNTAHPGWIGFHVCTSPVPPPN